MKERIRELMEQASSNACYDEPNQIHLMNDEIDMFAELIIQECIDVLNPDNELTSMREEYGRKMSMRLIQKHFGME